MEKVDQRLGILGACMQARREHEQLVFENLAVKCEHRGDMDSCEKSPLRIACLIKDCPFVKQEV